MDHVIPVGNESAPIKYSSLEAAAAQRKQRENSPNRNSHKSRYTSEPCKAAAAAPTAPLLGSGLEETDFPSVPAPPTPIGKAAFDLSRHVGAGGDGDTVDGKQQLQLQPAVDEDDYLQPSRTSQIPKYMDLLQDGTCVVAVCFDVSFCTVLDC